MARESAGGGAGGVVHEATLGAAAAAAAATPAAGPSAPRGEMAGGGAPARFDAHCRSAPGVLVGVRLLLEAAAARPPLSTLRSASS